MQVPEAVDFRYKVTMGTSQAAQATGPTHFAESVTFLMFMGKDQCSPIMLKIIALILIVLKLGSSQVPEVVDFKCNVVTGTSQAAQATGPSDFLERMTISGGEQCGDIVL